MLISVGYLIGPVALGIWFLGALIGDFGIMLGSQAAGIFDMQTGGKRKIVAWNRSYGRYGHRHIA